MLKCCSTIELTILKDSKILIIVEFAITIQFLILILAFNNVYAMIVMVCCKRLQVLKKLPLFLLKEIVIKFVFVVYGKIKP